MCLDVYERERGRLLGYGSQRPSVHGAYYLAYFDWSPLLRGTKQVVGQKGLLTHALSRCGAINCFFHNLHFPPNLDKLIVQFGDCPGSPLPEGPASKLSFDLCLIRIRQSPRAHPAFQLAGINKISPIPK